MNAQPPGVTLPIELWNMIFPNPEEFTRRNYAKTKEHLQTLRALSATSRFVREVALPRLWRFVHVAEVSELGRLHEVLNSSPSLARYVQGFTFAWRLPSMLGQLNVYPKEEGTLLDLAFRDRWEMWASYAPESDDELQVDDWGDGWLQPYFERDGEQWYEPIPPSFGMGPGIPRSLDPSTPKEADGPDGKGEDALIKSPDQLVSSVVRVVEKLVSLHSFKWLCAIMPMPMGVFRALEKLESLKTLHIDMELNRDNVHALPYWNLVTNVEDLSLHHFERRRRWHEEALGEQSETELTSYELPAQIPVHDNDGEERYEISFAVLNRTIVTAAKTGRLRRLIVDDVEPPFAVRSLLPRWVHIKLQPSRHSNQLSWFGAAQSLRTILSHASLWIGTTATSGARETRALAGQQVQALRSCFRNEDLPSSVREWNQDGTCSCSHPIERYLPWLEEDAELAEQVAQAWNALIESADADVDKCDCKRCKSQ